jgi:hypothetical protein
MKPYLSRSGKKSGVIAYETGADYIVVEFAASRYKYSYSSCGREAVETMKKLALASKGLSSFISRNDPAYEQKR